MNECCRTRNAQKDSRIFSFSNSLCQRPIANSMRSQIATSDTNVRVVVAFLPHHAFTENGAIMAANILNSPEAVREMSVFVVRAFVQMRELLGSTKELAKQLAALEKKLTARLDGLMKSPSWIVLRRVMDILDHHRHRRLNRREREIGFHVGMPEQNLKAMRKKIA